MMENVYLPAILLLLLFCGLCDDVSPEAEEPPPERPPEEPVNITNETVKNETEPHVNEQWDMINVENAEEQCLRQSRDYAKEEGYPTFLIYDCECAPDEEPEVKTYDCEVDAADGAHDVLLTCVKADRRCTVISEAGTDTYTFDELEALISQ